MSYIVLPHNNIGAIWTCNTRILTHVVAAENHRDGDDIADSIQLRLLSHLHLNQDEGSTAWQASRLLQLHVLHASSFQRLRRVLAHHMCDHHGDVIQLATP